MKINKYKLMGSKTWKLALHVGLSSCIGGLNAQNFVTDSITIPQTPGYQAYVVPACVTQIQIEAHGGQGGDAFINMSTGAHGKGGKGGKVTATINVTPGETLLVNIGGAGGSSGVGGLNGGGQGGSYGGGQGQAGGGGGMTAVYRNAINMQNLLVIAGGGGGGGAGGCGNPSGSDIGNGGAGIGLAGSKGNDMQYSAGGMGGTLNTAGAAGNGCSTTLGNAGSMGNMQNGGKGGDAPNFLCNFSASGGGGGAGMVGGAGGGAGSKGNPYCNSSAIGAGGGGAGGSSFIGNVDIPGTMVASTRSGHGIVFFKYTLSANSSTDLIASFTDTLCGPGSSTINLLPAYSSATNINWSVSGGLIITSANNTNSVTVSATSSGYVKVSLVDPCSNQTVVDSHLVYILDPNTITFNGTDDNLIVCFGESMNLNPIPSGGSFDYISGPSYNLNGYIFEPLESSAYQFFYTYIHNSGCTLTAPVNINSVCYASTENSNLSDFITIFPNPNTGDFNVNLEYPMYGTLKIVDLAGRVVFNKNINGELNHTINTNLKEGSYIISISSKEGNYNNKILIRK